jgi:predicted RecA/RadA family phage recombinase
MAQNFKQPGRTLTFPGTSIVCPAGNNKPTSGDPVKVGAAIVGVAEITAAATTDQVPINTVGVYNISVLAKTNGAVNSAVAPGDLLYISATAVVSKDTTGVLFGTAQTAVTSGATALCDVRLTGSF